ncbi:hypothetical protein NPIL_283791 [Nephila pilipes]|uniref:Uncharacterized protein n=1 Tax=Nephila pilipes TaxID=299642 RepID=A0A8X6TGV6_NEPPI|nr:hypothetical protein NPIL_283791 [Nephila pilipes]
MATLSQNFPVNRAQNFLEITSQIFHKNISMNSASYFNPGNCTCPHKNRYINADAQYLLFWSLILPWQRLHPLIRHWKENSRLSFWQIFSRPPSNELYRINAFIFCLLLQKVFPILNLSDSTSAVKCVLSSAVECVLSSAVKRVLSS